MNFPISQERVAFLTPSSLTYRDRSVESMGHGIDSRPAHPNRLAQWLRSLATRIAEMPRRRAAIAELEALSDRELADIGLARAELGRVFEPGFASRRGQIG